MTHKRQQDFVVRRITDVLVFLACAALETARFRLQPSSVPAWMLTGCVALAAIGVRSLKLTTQQSSHQRSASIITILLVLLVVPSAIEWLMQAWFGFGQAMEFHLAVCLRNFLLGAAATSYDPRHLRLSALLSLFLVVVASALAEDGVTWTLTAIYFPIGAWWLAASYWSDLQGHLISESKRWAPQRLRRLTATLIAAVGLFTALAVMLIGTMLPNASVARAIVGWFPTSGGTGAYDPFARSGIGDGDALVRATNEASSVGPIESDVFLTSDQPSLYDVFNDMYGEPVKPKGHERAVALDPSRNGLKEEQRWAENQRLSREFSTVRKHRPRAEQAQLQDLRSPALLYVAGRTPLHMRLQVFSMFDGTTWSYPTQPEERQRTRLFTVQWEQGKPWILTGLRMVSSSRTPRDQHVVKIVHLDTNRIPAPLGLARLHIDKVDQPDFFAWAEGEVVQMTRERIPPFTVIRLVSQVPAAGQLQEWAFPREGRVLAEADVTFAVPNNEQAAAIAALAKAWAGNASRGWPQIAAVVSRLREQYEHAPEATVPAGCHDSVAHFLLDSHRGPDYLFASAAAILLRHLGYRTRLVSGFYAAPEKYDSRSRHTPVVAQDVHFWAEVELGFNHWVTVEATPGYEVLQPPTTLAQRCLQAMRSAWQWCWNHPASLAAGCVVLVATAWYRRHLLDFLLRSLWHIPASRSAEACILATVWLLDRRCSCVGRPRPKFVTLTSWYGNSDVTKEGDTEAVKRLFLRMVDWYLYAPSPIRRSTPAWSQQEVRATCLWAIRFWSLRRCYRRFSQSGPRMQGRST